jgi:hypothetical protein
MHVSVFVVLVLFVPLIIKKKTGGLTWAGSSWGRSGRPQLTEPGQGGKVGLYLEGP